MTLRPYVVLALVRKDVARLLRNGPALMLLGMFVLVALLVASSGLVKDPEQERRQATSNTKREASWIVYREDEEREWIQLLKRRAPKELGIRFVEASQVDPEAYPTDICVIEIRASKYFAGRQQVRRPVHYRYPGSDPKVLWPVTRWFLSVSLEYFGQMPQFYETMEPTAPPNRREDARAALESVSVADVLNRSLIATAILTTIQFFSACGLLVALTAQERERGALRAIMLTPATFLEFLVSKAVVHGGLAFGASVIVVAALQPSALTSPLLWGTMIAQTCGYFSIGLLIASFAKNQAAPNLLTFAYILAIGTLYLLAYRFEVFRILSALTFERYALVLTITSLNATESSIAASLNAMRTPEFRMLVLISSSLLLLATLVGSRRLRA